MNDDQILTIEEAAQFLKMTEKQVYELTRTRSQERMEYPFPAFSTHSKAKRVRKSDLMAWIAKLAAKRLTKKRQPLQNQAQPFTMLVAARIGDGHRRADPKLNGRAPFD